MMTLGQGPLVECTSTTYCSLVTDGLRLNEFYFSMFTNRDESYICRLELAFNQSCPCIISPLRELSEFCILKIIFSSNIHTVMDC